MAFDERFAGKESLLDAFRSEGRIEEPDFLMSKVFLIISRRASIFSSCLVCANAMAAAMAEVTALEIMCYIAESNKGQDMLEVSSWNKNIVSK